MSPSCTPSSVRSWCASSPGEAGTTIRILYGGSGEARQRGCPARVSPEVGGALIGGASLEAAEFLAIAGAARRG